MFRSIQTKTMFFMASLAICLIVIIGYMTVFAMDYAIDEIKENDMRDKASRQQKSCQHWIKTA